MITAIRKRLDDREEGFTLIELLVVVIIIGILAAIAIPTFLNQRRRGWDAAAQSDLRNAAIAQESYLTRNNTYVGNGASELTQLGGEGFNPSTSVTLNVVAGDATRYCMSAQHASSSTVYYLSSDTGGTDIGTATCT